MARARSLFLTAFAVLNMLCSAAPMTVQELEFHLRVGTPEAEILRDLTARRLLVPLDAATESQLRAKGASPALLAQLKSGAFNLSPAEAQAALARQNANQQMAARQLGEAQHLASLQDERNAQIAASLKNRGSVQRWLQGQLVFQEGGTLKPLDPAKVSGVRVFAFYASASSSATGKRATPKLLGAYRELKAKYPEFEVIFVSHDRDEFNMNEHMRLFGMPWPALKYRQMPPELAGFFGDILPWLVLVGDDGRPLSQNAVDKNYLEPERIIDSLDGYLAQRRAQGM